MIRDAVNERAVPIIPSRDRAESLTFYKRLLRIGSVIRA